MNCKCFKCGNGFESLNEDAIAGDGECASCKERSAQVALKVDLDMEKKRREHPRTPSRIRQLFTEEQILKGEIAGAPRINIKDIGITPAD